MERILTPCLAFALCLSFGCASPPPTAPAAQPRRLPKVDEEALLAQLGDSVSRMSRWDLGSHGPAYLGRYASSGWDELLVLQRGDRDGEGDRTELWLRGAQGHLRYFPTIFSRDSFERPLTRAEVASLRRLLTGEGLATLPDYQSQVDDGWWYRAWWFTPKRAHTFLANNPDEGPQGATAPTPHDRLSSHLEALTEGGALRFRLDPGVRIPGLRVEFADPQLSVTQVWARGEDLRVRTAPQGTGSAWFDPRHYALRGAPDLADLPEGVPPEARWRRVSGGERGEEVEAPTDFASVSWVLEEADPYSSIEGELPEELEAVEEALTSSDGRFLAGTRAGRVVLYDLEARRFLPVNEAEAEGYRPLCVLPGRHDFVFVKGDWDPRDPGSWEPSSASTRTLVADRQESGLLSSSPGRRSPYYQRPLRPLQPSGRLVWATWVDPHDRRERATYLGRFDLDLERFVEGAWLHGLRVETDALWIDPTTQRGYALVRRVLVSFPLPKLRRAR